MVISTPFGKIEVLLDGKSISYFAIEGPADKILCPHVLGRFQITIPFKPDGEEHELSCVFTPVCQYNRSPESGEYLECQGFYNENRFKMSIGLRSDGLQEYKNGGWTSDEGDYDIVYLVNGLSYVIYKNTKKEEYEFGIAWIDDVGWNDPIDDNNNRSIETWFAADPTIAFLYD